MRTTSFTSRFGVLLLLAATLFVAACDSDDTAPSPIPIQQSLDVYSGPLDPGGTSTYLFTLGETSTVQLMLAGAVLDNPLRSIAPTLRLEFSRWDGTACVPQLSTDTAPRLTAALHGYFSPGTYCAAVIDPGNLTEPAGVTMRIVAPALLDTGGDPGTVTFASSITPAGTATRSFEASTPGTVSITLTDLSAGAVEAGLALGIWPGDGSGCKFAQVVRVVPSDTPHITTQVDPGDYCVMLYDVGNFTKNETFSVRIQHP
jgi:hypothetical protein